MDGLRDHEAKQVLILVCSDKLVDTLIRALEFEATKQSRRGQVRVLWLEDNSEGSTIDERKDLSKRHYLRKKQRRFRSYGISGT